MCKEDASESVAGEPARVLRLGQGKTLDALHSLRIHREDRGALPVAEAEITAEPSGTLVEEKKGRFLFRQVAQPLPTVRFQGILAPEKHPALHGRNVVKRRIEIHLRGVGQAAKPVPTHLDRLQRTLTEIGDEIPLPLLRITTFPPPAAEVAGQRVEHVVGIIGPRHLFAGHRAPGIECSGRSARRTPRLLQLPTILIRLSTSLFEIRSVSLRLQREEVDFIAVEVVEPVSVAGQLLPDSLKSLFVRAAGILHPDLVESGFMQHRNPFAPFFTHLSQRVVHVPIVFEQVQRLLYGPPDLREFTLTGRCVARIVLLLRLARRLCDLSDRRRVMSELIFEHLKYLHMGIPNSLACVDHHGFAHQPDAEPFERVEQLRELQRREHPVLHHGAVVDEQIAVAFVP